jgi:hypothetical protein
MASRADILLIFLAPPSSYHSLDDQRRLTRSSQQILVRCMHAIERRRLQRRDRADKEENQVSSGVLSHAKPQKSPNLNGQSFLHKQHRKYIALIAMVGTSMY